MCEDCLGFNSAGSSKSRWCCGYCSGSCVVSKLDPQSELRSATCPSSSSVAETGCSSGPGFFVVLLIVLAVALAVGGGFYMWRARGTSSGYEEVGGSFTKPAERGASSANAFAPYSEL